MNEQPDKPEVEEPVAAERAHRGGPRAGERLAEARREKQITVLEIAKELHLDEAKVRALESNDFEVLGAPVFAKGHLRKYAELVGVDDADVLGDYYELTRATGLPPVVGNVRRHRREIAPGPWIAALIIIVIVAAAYWWFVERDAGPQPVIGLVEQAGDGAGVPDSLDTAEQGEPDLAADTEPEPADASPLQPPDAAQPGIATDTAPAEATPTAPGELRVTLRFSGDCWTEVTDAGGERLFFDLGSGGRVVTVSGTAPLSVLLGNADNVAVAVNGVDYAIAAADRRGQTARFTIHAPE